MSRKRTLSNRNRIHRICVVQCMLVTLSFCLSVLCAIQRFVKIVTATITLTVILVHTILHTLCSRLVDIIATVKRSSVSHIRGVRVQPVKIYSPRRYVLSNCAQTKWFRIQSYGHLWPERFSEYGCAVLYIVSTIISIDSTYTLPLYTRRPAVFSSSLRSQQALPLFNYLSIPATNGYHWIGQSSRATSG